MRRRVNRAGDAALAAGHTRFGPRYVALSAAPQPIPGSVWEGRPLESATFGTPLVEMVPATAKWLWMALALGGLHALDADHVMAVSTLAGERDGARSGLRTGLRWSVGHGVMLLVAGAGLLWLGRALPDAVSDLAEQAVGIGMIALGGWVLFDLVRRGGHLHWHTHDGLPPHAHWHRHPQDAPHPAPGRHQHGHAATLVGALHGLAGSAPILALAPVAARSPVLGLVYLVIFGLGVAASMALVGGLLGHVAGRLSERANGAARNGLRAFAASGSIAIGFWLTLGFSAAS